MTRPLLHRRIFITILLFDLLGGVSSWHDLTNFDFHCWPLTASESNPATTGTCPGVTFKWIVAPPESIKAEANFNVTYELVADSTYYDWAVDEGFFDYLGYTNGTVAQQWCENQVCPSDLTSVTESTCCIHHVNVHSCPLSTTSYCGPWIKAEGETYTHSDVLWGSPLVGNWTSSILGLYTEGDTQIIAHIKMAGMQMALYANVEVLPKTVCGDNLCEDLEGEDCLTCPKDCGQCPLKAWQIALAALAGFIVVAVIVVMLLVYAYKERKMLWDESWIVTHEAVMEAQSKKAAFGSTLTLGQGLSRSSLGSAMKSANHTTNMQQSAANKQLFTKVTVVSGKTCAIRDVPKKHFQLTKKVRIEVKKLRSMDHQNVCKFVAACIEVPNVCILMEYCPKGSLSDVLQNLDIPLNWGFRFSFALDIARGMCHMLSHDVIHGRLTSNNCVIDDRWTVKITDCGLETLRAPEFDSLSAQGEEESYKDRQFRVYRPPEANQKGYVWCTEADVFAFGVILTEIATRNDPYGDEDSYDLPTDWRPPLPDLSDSDSPEHTCPCPKQYLELIRNCWYDSPAQRPSFDTIKKIIQRINPNKQSPVDLMMTMMEKYSKHLESIVMERTSDLMAEKQKTDRLLYSMLPRAVADELRQGKNVCAEEYSSVTIYFSDIVGFTVISGKSNPFQVVALLNKLYTCFDSIIENYDVYKVETIGDAYMVVSGVPVRNGKRHAHQIASMSLDIVEACRTFTIPHLPNDPLKIRVGLHSGSVCAGVVGLKMPRYCLFGDTVNTASRMESNGEAYRIHLSNFTYEYLNAIGGFDLELRGTIPVKGKGDMKTWWLNGKHPEKHALETTSKGTERKISNSNDSGYNEAAGSPENGKLTPVADV